MQSINERQSVTFEWEDPNPHIARAMSWDGLRYMQAYANGSMPAPPIAELMNIEMREVERGRVVFATTPEPYHVNTIGTVHGGFTATVLDSTLGCAVHGTLPVGMAYTTSQLNIHYTRAITPHVGEMFCEGVVVHEGRKMCTAEAHLRDGRGKLYAHATASCLILSIFS